MKTSSALKKSSSPTKLLLMKTFLFSCFLLCCTLPTTAQYRYIPYVEEGKYWLYNENDGGDLFPRTWGRLDWIGADTLLNGVKYFKLFTQVVEDWGYAPFKISISGGKHYGFLREDTLTKQVFLRYVEDFAIECRAGEIELYNFDLVVGDTLSPCHYSHYTYGWNGQPDIKLAIIDSVYYDLRFNRVRKIYSFISIQFDPQPWASFFKSELIEGVGLNVSSFLHGNYSSFNYFCERTSPECDFVSAVQPLRPDPAVLDLYPNPAGEVLYLRTEEPAPSISLWDHCGVPVAQYAYTNEIPLHTLPAGIYILRIVDRRNRVAVRRFVKK